MSPAACVSLLLSLTVAAGCGERVIDPDHAYKPEQLQGEVDTSLPPPLQAKQQAVKAVLDTLQFGMDFNGLRESYPHIRFRETEAGFLEGTVGLHGWKFDGPPVGDDVPVLLQLYEDSTGENIREAKRVYTVTDARGRVEIRRKR